MIVHKFVAKIHKLAEQHTADVAQIRAGQAAADERLARIEAGLEAALRSLAEMSAPKAPAPAARPGK